jgi:Ser/Thr protein kinase RdoA (MazF antagonist)
MSYDAQAEVDLQEIVNEYGLGGVTNVCKAEGGTANESWVVRTATGTVVVRKVSEGRSLNDILFEHSFIRALDREGFPYCLPKPLRARAGRSVVAMNGAYVWLYNYIEGSRSPPPRNTVILQMARALAAAHKAAGRFSLRRTKATPIALEHPSLLHSLRRLQLEVADRPSEHHRFFGAHVQECIGILEQFRCTLYNTLPRLPIHGDMCGENLVFSKERLRGVIDFDHCCSDTAIRDIAIGLRYECWNETDGYRLDYRAARYFIESYHEITPLTHVEIDLIPAIVIAELADLFRWRIVEIITKRAAVRPVAELENLFKAIRWYSQHQKDITRALRI